jgi:hypothetical protein
MRRGPGVKEDAKNLGIVGGSAALATLITAGLLLGRMTGHETVHVQYKVDPTPTSLTYRVVTPLSGTNRLYGTVHTVGGEQLTGYIRWDRNEGSWTDLLDANKPTERGGASVSGIRFGHVEEIEVLDSESALFTLKSGDEVELRARASDLGTGLRALTIDHDGGSHSELQWRDLDRIEFNGAPSAARPAEGRLFGTLRTRSGMEFTGYIAWDVDEIYSSDILDGDLDGERLRIPFGAISSIERHASWAARVRLHDGEELILDGTNDVDDSNSGISVSDAALGQVKVEWDEFESVRFHGTDTEVVFSAMDGGSRIEGTVTTEAGEQLSGTIRWDSDEAYTWEMLNGDAGEVEFNVEFGMIAGIVKTTRGAEVTLLDGRAFELTESNDVDDGNRGIVVETDSGNFEVEWDDFRQLTLSN